MRVSSNRANAKPIGNAGVRISRNANGARFGKTTRTTKRPGFSFRTITRGPEPTAGGKTGSWGSAIDKVGCAFHLPSGTPAILSSKNGFTDFLDPRGTTAKTSRSLTITSMRPPPVRTQKGSTNTLNRDFLTNFSRISTERGLVWNLSSNWPTQVPSTKTDTSIVRSSMPRKPRTIF